LAFDLKQMPDFRPEPEPGPEPEPDFPLVIGVFLSYIFGGYQDPFADIIVEFRNSANSPPDAMLNSMQQRELTDQEKLELFRRLVGYVRQVPIDILRAELERLQRTIHKWLFWRNLVQISPDSLISMTVTLAILATHRAIDVLPVIHMFEPFVERHVIDDPNLTPLLTMLRMPENARNIVVWLENIDTSFLVLLDNIQRLRANMLVPQV
jgi:hypothetical protein